MTPLFFISGEEEARAETVLFVVSTSHRTSDSRLSRPSPPIQPKDVSVVGSISPCLDLFLEVGSGAWETCRVMPALVVGERGLVSGW